MRIKFSHIVLLIAMTWSTLSVHAQEKVADIIQKAAAKYENQTDVSYTTTHRFYAEYQSKKPQEVARGLVIKKNGVSYFKLKNTEMVSFSDYSLQISHDQKAIVVQPTSKDKTKEQYPITQYLEGFESKLTTTATHYICEFTAPSISGVLLSKAVVTIRKKDHTIESQAMYYVEQMKTKKADGTDQMTQPKVVITYQPRKVQSVQDAEKIKKSNYFKIQNNEMILATALKDYQLYY